MAPKVKYAKDNKVFIKFDIKVLDMMIGFIFKDSVQVTRKALNNMRKLFAIIDQSSYNTSPKLEARVNFITRALDAKLNRGFESNELIVNYCLSDTSDPENDEIVKNLPLYEKLNYEEIKFINKAVEDRLVYSYLINYKDSMYATLEKLDSGEFDSFAEINYELKSICTEFINTTRKARTLDDAESISIGDEDFEMKTIEIVEALKNPSSVLITGIRALNQILSPGFISGRLYCFMGLPGGFKSGTLLKVVRDIKKYNAGYSPRKPGKTPTVLLVTMENKVDETVERLFNMVSSDSDIRNFSAKQVVKMLKKEGELQVTDDNNIDIVIQYKPNRSIDTSDLYTIISDLEDNGKEVIALVLDYLKRIRPHEYGKDEKEELKNITNELKTLAIELNIPVITAHQLNRSGAATVDSAMQSNKADLARLLGRANIGSALTIRAAA